MFSKIVVVFHPNLSEVEH